MAINEKVQEYLSNGVVVLSDPRVIAQTYNDGERFFEAYNAFLCGATGRELAQGFGVSRSTCQGWKRNRYRPTYQRNAIEPLEEQGLYPLTFPHRKLEDINIVAASVLCTGTLSKVAVGVSEEKPFLKLIGIALLSLGYHFHLNISGETTTLNVKNAAPFNRLLHSIGLPRGNYLGETDGIQRKIDFLESMPEYLAVIEGICKASESGKDRDTASDVLCDFLNLVLYTKVKFNLDYSCYGINLPGKRLREELRSKEELEEMKNRMREGSEMRYVLEFVQLMDSMYPELSIEIGRFNLLEGGKGYWQPRYHLEPWQLPKIARILDGFYKRMMKKYGLIIVPSGDGMKIQEVGLDFGLESAHKLEEILTDIEQICSE